jgi:hypothetical protein
LTRDIADLRALDPFVPIIEEGLHGLAAGTTSLTCWPTTWSSTSLSPFRITHARWSAVTTIELFRGYGETFFLDRCYGLRINRSDATSTVVLEHASEGKVVASGYPYSNRYISVITLSGRKVDAVARLPRSPQSHCSARGSISVTTLIRISHNHSFLKAWERYRAAVFCRRCRRRRRRTPVGTALVR